MLNDRPLVSVVILTHNSEHYLPELFHSIQTQTHKPMEVIVAENYSTDQTRNMLQSLEPATKVLMNDNRNLWFSKPNNLGIQSSKGKYVLICNHDIFLDPCFVEELVLALELDPQLGSAIGKVLKFAGLKKNIESAMIDTTGIKIFRNRRAVDRGESQMDQGQFDQSREVFGGSGALTMYRREAMDQVAFYPEDDRPEYFDEDFNAFQEDVDLAWRLQSAGWFCAYVPTAIAWHHRTASQRKGLSDLSTFFNRKTKSQTINALSYRNHLLTILKNEEWEALFPDLVFFLFYELKKFLYLLFFEQKTLSVIPELFKLRKILLRKRHHIQELRAIPAKQLAKKWFRTL